MTQAEPGPSAGGALRVVLANPALRRIEIAWSLGTAGDAALLVALLVAAFGYGGPAAVGVLTIVRMAPSVIAAPLAGLVAGRRPPMRLLFLAHLLRAWAALVAMVGLGAGSAIGVVVGATIGATAGAFIRPLQVAAMPTIARSPDELVAANVVSSGGEGVGAFVGPLLAGFIVGWAGSVVAAFAAAVAFVGGALALTGRLTTADAEAEDDAERRNRSVTPVTLGAIARELTAGVRSLAGHSGAATLLAALSGQVFVRGLLTALTTVIAIRLVDLGDPGVGTLWAAYGLG